MESIHRPDAALRIYKDTKRERAQLKPNTHTHTLKAPKNSEREASVKTCTPAHTHTHHAIYIYINRDHRMRYSGFSLMLNALITGLQCIVSGIHGNLPNTLYTVT